MFCKNCGKEVVDGKRFCGGCGAPVQQEFNAVNNSQPMYSLEPKLSKGRFISEKASQNVRQTAMVSRIIGIVCMALCVVICFASLSTAIDKLPIVEIFSDGEELPVDNLERIVDNPANEEEFEDYEYLENSIEKVIDNPSMLNITNMVKMTEKYGDDINEDTSEIEEFGGMFSVIIIIAVAYCAFVLLITSLAVFLRNNVFTVAGLLFGILYALLFAGALYVIFMIVAYIALFVTQMLVNSEYRKYRLA